MLVLPISDMNVCSSSFSFLSRLSIPFHPRLGTDPKSRETGSRYNLSDVSVAEKLTSQVYSGSELASKAGLMTIGAPGDMGALGCSQLNRSSRSSGVTAIPLSRMLLHAAGAAAATASPTYSNYVYRRQLAPKHSLA